MRFQSRHLALLQAAVRYFQEEFGPHPADALQAYLPQPDPGLTTEHLHELQWLVEQAQQRRGRQSDDAQVIELLSHGEGIPESRRADLVTVLLFAAI